MFTTIQNMTMKNTPMPVPTLAAASQVSLSSVPQAPVSADPTPAKIQTTNTSCTARKNQRKMRLFFFTGCAATGC